MEVATSIDSTQSVASLNTAVDEGHEVAEDDNQADHCTLSETNDNASASNNVGDNVEERFRVDRRKLEQLIQGRTSVTSVPVIKGKTN